ncbi:cytochrome c oxidase subunit II [Haloplanus rubicundus]|uniref:Cytochrome c oxidase subunit II n=1 Tax=Haloplanus rubicundus TaxID=1547898 RepID=A0A345E0K7_9EURY|nr:cytochrome c oxidase subunit II [Haloplanus rubicundus]AXG05729.1 cytochrome c oxidase subunit II [Haloplanus rubicundus]AXG09065.1 cytochrome c oxidase subunit II [Haloplanus rubicundus]
MSPRVVPVRVLLQPSLVPRGARSEIFREIYVVFLILGTLVGVVVIAYMLHKAYRYRAAAERADDRDRPQVGELPTGGGGGRKLFVSLALSAVIVVSLITWTYFTLLYVEDPEPVAEEEPLEIRVVGHQFYWEFIYPDGRSVQGTLRVPEDRRVRLQVTSADVFHNFGVPELRAKADAIPGQRTETWFVAEETGTYQAHCYELCGAAHSYMDATVRVMEPDAYRQWYANGSDDTTGANATVEGNASAVASGRINP